MNVGAWVSRNPATVQAGESLGRVVQAMDRLEHGRPPRPRGRAAGRHLYGTRPGQALLAQSLGYRRQADLGVHDPRPGVRPGDDDEDAVYAQDADSRRELHPGARRREGRGHRFGPRPDPALPEPPRDGVLRDAAEDRGPRAPGGPQARREASRPDGRDRTLPGAQRHGPAHRPLQPAHLYRPPRRGGVARLALQAAGSP